MKKIHSILLLLGIVINVAAQDIIVLTEAPSVVAVGEQFRVTWTVNQRGGSLIAPEFKDFYKIMGPQTSFSSNMSNIGGKITSTVKNSFTYYLQATKEGKFVLPPAKYIDKNKEYQSRAVEIEVVASGTETANQAGDETSGTPGSSVNSSDLYVRLLVNRNSVTIGEHIVATLKIYSRVNLSGLQEVKYPDFNGFLKTDIETPVLRNLERENIGGQIYSTGVLQRFLLYPQKTGKLEIDPASLTVLVQEQAKSNDPFFGDFFSSFNTVQKILVSTPVSIEVSSLPAGAPDYFSGTVGSFTLSSTISTDTLAVNDALTYRVVLKGSGNLRLSSAPKFELAPDIEVYEPKIIPDLKTSVNGTNGSKIFEYVLIPRHHGQYQIPSVKYSYFDPDANQYKTLTSKPYTFFVKKSDDENTETQVYGSITKEDITYLGKDIRYIHTGDTRLRRVSELMISRSSFFIFYLSALILFFLIVFWRRESIKRNSDLVKVKNRKAAKVASARLKLALRYIKESNDAGFYTEALRALWGYLSDKLSIPAAEINISLVIDDLIKRGVKEETVDLLKRSIEECEYSRYSPEGEIRSTKEIYVNIENVIKDIENGL